MSLQMVVASFVPLIRRQLADHLEGGALTSLSEEQRKNVERAPKDNILGERIFGELDKSMADKPNMTALHREASILFPHNKTGDWLLRHSMADQRRYLGAARKLAPVIEKRWKEQQAAIRKQQQDILERRFTETAIRASNKAERLRTSINNTLRCGGVWSAESCMTEMGALSDLERKKAVCAQLAYHRNSEFKCKPASLASQTEKGRAKSADVLQANLLEILRQLATPESSHNVEQEIPTILEADDRRAKLDAACQQYLAVAEPKAATGRARGSAGRSRGRGSAGRSRGRGSAGGRGRGRGSAAHDPGSSVGAEAEHVPDLLHKHVELLFDIDGAEEWCEGVVVRQLPCASRDILDRRFVVVFDEYNGEFEYTLYSDYFSNDLRILGDMEDVMDSDSDSD
jgi:hypothetical protein